MLEPIPIPDGYIKLKLSYIVSFICLIVSLGIAAGGYRAGMINQGTDLAEAKHEISLLHDSVNQLNYTVGRLSQSMDDLKASIDLNRFQDKLIKTPIPAPPDKTNK